MKKEWIALALLLSILALSLWCIRTLDALTADVRAAVAQAADHARSEDWKQAEACTEQALSRWRAGIPLARLILRHSMLDAVTESLIAVQTAIQRRDTVEVTGAGRLAADRLRELAETERPTPGNVF